MNTTRQEMMNTVSRYAYNGYCNPFGMKLAADTQEDTAAFGAYLLETISDIYACEATEADINKSVTHTHECWCRFDELGVVVGTTVPESDAEFEVRVDLSEDPETLKANFLNSIQECLDMAEEFENTTD